MALFNYTTIEGDKGTVDAADYDSAVSILRSENKVVVSLEEVKVKEVGVSFFDYLFIKKYNIALFFRQLSTLFKAGITLTDALGTLEKQSEIGGLRKVIKQIRQDIEKGSRFSDALKKHHFVFTPIVTGVVTAGEESGSLDIVLEKIATYLEEREAFKKEVVRALIYPAIVVIMSILVILFLVGYVLPKILPVFQGFGGELPWNAKFLINLTNFFKEDWHYLVGGIIGIAVFAKLLYSFINPVKYWVDRIKVRIPIIGKVFRYAVVIRFTRNLSTLIKGGLSMSESLRVVRGVVGNEAAKKTIIKMEKSIIRGERLSTPLKKATYIFSPIVADMVTVGESTGNMDIVLDLTADMYEKMLQSHIKKMNALIEPAIIVTLGAMVGFVIWTFFSVILSIYASIGR